MDKNALTFCNDLLASLGDGFKAEEGGDKNSKSFSGHIDAGTLGADVSINVLQSDSDRFNVRIKATQTYQYRVSEIDAAEWQAATNEKYDGNGGYSVYFTAPTLTFAKFFATSSGAFASAKASILKAIATIKKIIPDFEKKCVDFDVESEHTQTDYDPTNVEFKTVDDKFHMTATSEEDIEETINEDSAYAEEKFYELAEKYGLKKEDVVETAQGLPTFTFKYDDTDMAAVLHKDDGDIKLIAMTPATDETGAMYLSHSASAYPELTAKYNKERKRFTVKTDVFPYKYMPTAIDDAMAMLSACIKSCKEEWDDTLGKKDSEKFAIEMRNIMSEQAKKLTERETALSEKEKEIQNLQKEFEASKKELEEKERAFEEEKERFEKEKEKAEERIKKIQDEADGKVKKYEEQNTKDIMNMQTLAKQISLLQDKLNAAPSSSDADVEDEITRLRAKTRQLTLQKASVEKEIKNITAEKDAKIKKLTDVISEKEQDIAAMKNEINTKVSAKVKKETLKSQEYVSGLEAQLKKIGHIITPDEIFEYYKKNEGDDAGVEEKHARDATIISFKEGELDVAIRVGALCSIEVSKNTAASDKVLRRLNTKFGDIKFYISPTQQQTTARAYFAPNASIEQIDNTLDRVLDNFRK